MALVVLSGAAGLIVRRSHSAAPPTRTPSGDEMSPVVTDVPAAPSFCRDVAPILYAHCAGCHRPDQAAPFGLLEYSEARKHARDIVEVTSRRVMPPWPPEPGYGTFAHERRLTPRQLEILRRWHESGAPEGALTDLPPKPKWPVDWQSGTPDLVVTVPRVYTLAAEGSDLYRNFVVPIPVETLRFVTGVEFRPGNARVVHHAFLNIDETRQSRWMAAREDPPGFDGMDLPESAVMPAGQLLGWQPGKVAYHVDEGLSWVLKPKTDLVLQLHLQRTGKAEAVQPSIGFYFGSRPPTNHPYRIRLASFELDIPPGESNYVVEQRYELPVDVRLLRVNPHAHYLGKDIRGYALLPGGEKRWLLWIKHWDFNWQGDYAYAEPVELPKGSTLVMRFTYDNSTNNLRNPHQPPVRVRHGPNTVDEMAALGFQALTRNETDRAILAKDQIEKLLELSLSYERFVLRHDPDDAMAHVKLARILASRGVFEEAEAHLKTALQLKPTEDKAYYELGYLHLRQDRLVEANRDFIAVVRLNPRDSQAFGNLGLIALKQRRPKDARAYLEVALRLNPDDAVARQNLALVGTLESGGR
ncbi:MAG: tetratricopeptide repeat protein [Verrucomicrobiales bacterium]|nr:tetratricopeptide repeat protein [Verrucomicrobiales bacterium]